MSLREIGRSVDGDGSVVYLDECGRLVVRPSKPAGPKMQKELRFEREDSINLAMAILEWQEGADRVAANQGPGVPAELRERLARRASKRWYGPWRSFDAADHSVRAAFEREADEILSEIAASGYVIVASDRMDRLRVWAEYAERADDRGRFTKAYRPTVMLQPGDLDAGEPGAGR